MSCFSFTDQISRDQRRLDLVLNSHLTPFNRPAANDLGWRTHIQSLTKLERAESKPSNTTLRKKKKEQILGFMLPRKPAMLVSCDGDRGLSRVLTLLLSDTVEVFMIYRLHRFRSGLSNFCVIYTYTSFYLAANSIVVFRISRLPACRIQQNMSDTTNFSTISRNR